MFEINWQEIKTNFPKGYEKFVVWAMEYKFGFFSVISGYASEKYFLKRLKDICYCDIVSFFDELGIIIVVDYYFYDAEYYFYFTITKPNGNTERGESVLNEFSRSESQKQAVPKAFEILEKQLGEK